MAIKPLSRRAFLIGAGAAIPLPFLEAMLPINVTWAAEPLRFGVFYKPWGMWLENIGQVNGLANQMDGVWGPQLLSIMKPYEAHTTIITKMINPGYGYADDVNMDNHLEHQSFMTGQKNFIKSTSVDRLISQRLNPAGILFPNGLHMGIAGNNPISFFNGVDSTYYSDPRALFDLITRLGGFGSGAGTPSTTTTTMPQASPLLTRKSVLDRAKDSISSLQSKLSNHDKAILDQHLTALQQLERTLASTTPPPAGTPTTTTMPRPAACASPVIGNNLTQQQRMEALIDLAAIAINCDLTRTLTFEMNRGGGGNNDGREYPQIPANVETGYHGWTHARLGGCSTPAGGADCIVNRDEAQRLMRLADQYELGLFARFLSKTNLPDVFTNSAFVFGGGGGPGGDHGAANIPFCLVGRAGGSIRPQGQAMYSVNGAYNNNMWLTLMQKLGVPITSFGAFNATSTINLPA